MNSHSFPSPHLCMSPQATYLRRIALRLTALLAHLLAHLLTHLTRLIHLTPQQAEVFSTRRMRTCAVCIVKLPQCYNSRIKFIFELQVPNMLFYHLQSYRLELCYHTDRFSVDMHKKQRCYFYPILC